MTTEVWIELKFEVEYNYIGAEPETGTNDTLEMVNITSNDPRVQGEVTIPTSRIAGMSDKVAAEHAKLLDQIEQDCRKDLEESYEDPRI